MKHYKATIFMPSIYAPIHRSYDGQVRFSSDFVLKTGLHRDKFVDETAEYSSVFTPMNRSYDETSNPSR